ncbi:hypothetical protein Aduo_018990 [Ancylostoma duodenale]
MCKQVAIWWSVLKGFPFLPVDLIRKAPVTYRPPVPVEHEAHTKCQEFLPYLHSTWIDGPFKGLLCKWNSTELRTTNLAETFHSHLRKHLDRQADPDFKTLLHRLPRSNPRANFELWRLQLNFSTSFLYFQKPTEDRHLRKRDRERRIKVGQRMKDFEQLQELNGICMRTSDITIYCRRMSRFTSGKSIRISESFDLFTL